MSEFDTVFSLPAVDEEPDTELGVLLMGLAADRLLAALGITLGTARGGTPATAMLVVDQLRHGTRTDLTFDTALGAGARRWRAARPRLVAAAPATEFRSAALRQLWASSAAVVHQAGVATDHAERLYLTACWLRRDEIDQAAAARS